MVGSFVLFRGQRFGDGDGVYAFQLFFEYLMHQLVSFQESFSLERFGHDGHLKGGSAATRRIDDLDLFGLEFFFQLLSNLLGRDGIHFHVSHHVWWSCNRPFLVQGKEVWHPRPHGAVPWPPKYRDLQEKIAMGQDDGIETISPGMEGVCLRIHRTSVAGVSLE